MACCYSHETAIKVFIYSGANTLVNMNEKINVSSRRFKELTRESCQKKNANSLRKILTCFDDKERLDCLILNKAHKRPDRLINWHRLNTNANKFCIYEIRNSVDLYVVCPELAFVQYAANHGLIDVIRTGSALCSNFMLTDECTSGIAQVSTSVTSVAKIKKFISNNSYMSGNQQANRALRYIVQGAWSPRESALALCLTLPRQYGGFALGKITMNKQVKLLDQTYVLGQKKYKTRIPDIMITARGYDKKKYTVGIDYDSDAFHADIKSQQRDLMRENQLSLANSFRHISISTSMITDYMKLFQTVDQIRLLLKQRKHWSRMKKIETIADYDPQQYIWEKHIELWRRLFFSKNDCW